MRAEPATTWPPTAAEAEVAAIAAEPTVATTSEADAEVPIRLPEAIPETSLVAAFDPAPLPPPTIAEPLAAAAMEVPEGPMPPAPFADWPDPIITARLLAFELVITVEPSPVIPFAPHPTRPVLTPALPGRPGLDIGPLIGPTTERNPVDQQLMAAILGDVDEAGL